MTELTRPFNKYFDHTLLQPEAATRDIEALCQEAVKYDFYSVCVNGSWVSTARRLLEGSDVKVACVCGFPLGASATQVKLREAGLAIDEGAGEIDMVMNIGRFKDKDFEYVEEEIRAVAQLCHEKGALLKVIIETCKLTESEIYRASRTVSQAGADFVKTSTGWGSRGASARHILQIKRGAGQCRVKASGGIGTLAEAMSMIQAGADRIGASASAAIMEEYLSR